MIVFCSVRCELIWWWWLRDDRSCEWKWRCDCHGEMESGLHLPSSFFFLLVFFFLVVRKRDGCDFHVSSITKERDKIDEQSSCRLSLTLVDNRLSLRIQKKSVSNTTEHPIFFQRVYQLPALLLSYLLLCLFFLSFFSKATQVKNACYLSSSSSLLSSSFIHWSSTRPTHQGLVGWHLPTQNTTTNIEHRPFFIHPSIHPFTQSRSKGPGRKTAVKKENIKLLLPSPPAAAPSRTAPPLRLPLFFLLSSSSSAAAAAEDWRPFQ